MTKHKLVGTLLLFFCLIWGAVSVQADGGNGTAGDSYYTALKSYFKVSDAQIASCQQGGIQDEELPVVFFIAQRANVDSDAVVVVHSSSLSWMQVAAHFHLNPRIFFIPIQGVLKNTPYAQGYSYYQNRKDRVNLTDDDMINFVNLKFIAEHYARNPMEIVQMRTLGKSFRDINQVYANAKDEARWDVVMPSGDNATVTPSATPMRHHHRHSQQ